MTDAVSSRLSKLSDRIYKLEIRLSETDFSQYLKRQAIITELAQLKFSYRETL